MSTVEDSGASRNFSVKDILVEFVLPQLRAIDSKLDKKADAVVVNAIQLRLETLEKTFVTRDEKHKLEKDIAAGALFDAQREQEVEGLRQMRIELESLKTWRNRLAGAVAVLAAAFTPILVAIVEKARW